MRASAAEPESAEPSPVVRPDSRAGLLPAPPRTQPRALRRRSTLANPEGPGEVHPALLQRQQLLAMAAMLQDDAQREALLGDPAALPDLLADCSSGRAEVRGGAYECLASLTAHDAMRQRVRELRLLPMLLDGAASSAAQVQRPAAACIANLCADPALVLEEVGAEPGLAPIVALALSGDGEVQRHAAAALWHLAAWPEARRRAVDAGALHALLALGGAQRNVSARDLARQALLRCSDDEAIRPRLEEVAAAAGMDAAQLSAMVAPNSARSGASSQRKARHRKMYSGAQAEGRRAAYAFEGVVARLRVGPSTALLAGLITSHPGLALAHCCAILPAAEVPSSLSGAISRTSSYRSGIDQGSPAYASGAVPSPEPWPADSESQTPGLGASPLQLSPVLEVAGGAAQPNGVPLLAANGAADEQRAATGQQQQQQPLRLQLPEGSPLPLPIITPVAVGGDSSPPAKRQLPAASAAAQEAAASSPKGAVHGRVQQLERLNSHPVPHTPE